MTRKSIIVIGASAGGIEALQTLVADLPRDLPAAVFVVVHTSTQPSLLPRILDRAGSLMAVPASDGAAIAAGTIYAAPAGHHLLLSHGHMHVVEGPKENGFRPAIDPLFRSASRAYSTAVIGVVLSGMLDDGTAGLVAITRHGGVAVVQDPREALAPSMPLSALRYVTVDYTVPVTEMGALLGRLAIERAVEEDDTMAEALFPPSGKDGPADVTGDQPGSPLPISCPECSGVLSEVREGSLLRFRCQIGHRYSPASVVAQQSEATQRALSAALTAVNERELLLRRLAQDATDHQDHAAVRRFGAQAAAAAAHHEQVRALLGAVEAAVESRDEPPEGMAVSLVSAR